MILPLSQFFGHEASLALGTVIGVGFGFTLERAGFGQAPVLAAQFYASDTRVLKVMFSAIVTALGGMTLLSGVGLLDLSQVTVPETFLWPQIVGGLLLGVGFIVSGYCPGTSWVSAASGNLDGVATIGGVIAGSLGFGLVYPAVADFYASGAMGVARLPDLLGIPQAVLAAGVAAMAIGAFLFGEWGEKALAKARGEEPPPSNPSTRNRVFAGFGVVAALGLGTMILPAPSAPALPDKAVATLDAVTLAKALIDRPGAVQVFDLRPAAECAAKAIPGATCGADDAAFAKLPATRTLVVYGAGDLAALPDGIRAVRGDVAKLQGGFEAFRKDILEPPAIPADAKPAEVADYRLRVAMSAYFTGVKPAVPTVDLHAAQAPAAAAPAAAPATAPASAPAPEAPKKGGGC